MIMKEIEKKLLGIYDLLLASGAIYIGVKMVNSNSGIFIEYPEEWISKVPFESGVIPGIIAIVLFGLGNVIAAIFSFRKANNRSWLVSGIMGGIFFISLIAQVIILEQCYLATVEFMIFSIIQLGLSGYVFCRYKKIHTFIGYYIYRIVIHKYAYRIHLTTQYCLIMPIVPTPRQKASAK